MAAELLNSIHGILLKLKAAAAFIITIYTFYPEQQKYHSYHNYPWSIIMMIMRVFPVGMESQRDSNDGRRR